MNFVNANFPWIVLLEQKGSCILQIVGSYIFNFIDNIIKSMVLE